MADLFGIVSNTLAADETALQVASENTAGASSPTYHAQAAVLGPAAAGADPIGATTPPAANGMEVVTLVRATDPTATAGLLSALGGAALASTAVAGLQPLTSFFAAGAAGGVQVTLQNLESAWGAYQDAPTSAAAAQAVYGAAQQVAHAINTAQTQLAGVAGTLLQQAGHEATQMGALLQNIATNQQALATLPPNTTAANTLLDQVDGLTQTLAQLAGATSHPTETNQRLIAAPGDGPVWVDGGQVPLMNSGGTVLSMSVSAAGPWYTASVTLTAGSTVAWNPSAGEIAGTLQALDTVEQWGAQLAAFSQQLASTVPAASPSTALFVATATGGLGVTSAISASTLQASIAPAAQTAIATGLQQWGTLAAGVGTVTQQLQNSASAASNSVTGYQEALQRAVGVDPNQAAVALMQDQEAFQATAQLLATQQSLVSTLLQAVA